MTEEKLGISSTMYETYICVWERAKKISEILLKTNRQTDVKYSPEIQSHHEKIERVETTHWAYKFVQTYTLIHSLESTSRHIQLIKLIYLYKFFFFFLRFCFAFFYSKKTYCLLDAIMAPERFVISCIMGEKTKRARWTKENVITHNRHYFNFIFWKINTHTMTKEVENRHAGKGWSEMGVLWANEKKVGKKSARSRREKQEK